jgi:hypothetical protein
VLREYLNSHARSSNRMHRAAIDATARPHEVNAVPSVTRNGAVDDAYAINTKRFNARVHSTSHRHAMHLTWQDSKRARVQRVRKHGHLCGGSVTAGTDPLKFCKPCIGSNPSALNNTVAHDALIVTHAPRRQ